MSFRLPASMLGAVVISTSPSALADIQEIVQLGTLSGDYVSAFAINDALKIVGSAQLNSGNANGYLWDGTLMDLEFHGSARDITAFGRIAGFLLVGNDAEAIVWEDGVLTPLGTLPNGTDSQAFGINESGLIVGGARNEGDSDNEGYDRTKHRCMQVFLAIMEYMLHAMHVNLSFQLGPSRYRKKFS